MLLTTANFSLQIRYKAHTTVLIMQFFNEAISTRQFPYTLQLLEQHAPKVLQTKCFNPLNLSFREEVVNTELGHLFEHILIQFLCEETIIAGADAALFDAETEWNWRRYPKGNFKIVVQGKVKKEILQRALLKSIRVVELLFATQLNKTEKVTDAMRQQPLVRPLSESSMRM